MRIQSTICIAALSFYSLISVAPNAVAEMTTGALPANLDGVVTSPRPARTVSLAESFERADLHNREVASAKWNLPIAKGAVKAAGAVPNPQLLVQTGFANSFNFLFTGQTQQYGIAQQFQTAGKRTKKIALARANYGLAELQLDALRFDVHNRVRRAYSELAAAEAYEAVVESERQVGIKLADIASKRFEAGKAPKAEALQANLNVLQFDTLRNQAQGRLQQASAALALITGERPEHVEVIDVNDNGIFKLSAEKSEIVPSPRRSMPVLAQLLTVAFASRPDLKAAQQQIYVNKKALALAKTKKVPDVFVGIGGTFSTFAKNQPAGLASVGNWAGTGLFFSVTAENPILYQYQGEVQQATANLRRAERKLALLHAQVGADVVTAFNEVIVARDNIFEFQNELLPTAAEVARVARRGYQLGATDLSTTLVAQLQYQQTLSNYFDAVVAYQIAWSDLEKAVGLPLLL